MDNNFLHIEYTQADIERYIQGKMSNAEMYAIEKAALQDPFLADAIEGYEITNFDKAKEELATASSSIINTVTQKTPSQNTYSINDFEQYFSGNMSQTEMYLIEKNAQKENFINDAFDGYANTNFTKAKEYLAETEKKILGTQKQEAKVIALGTNNYKQWLRIAVGIILMFGVGSTLWYVNNKKQNNTGEIAQVTKHQEISNFPSTQKTENVLDNIKPNKNNNTDNGSIKPEKEKFSPVFTPDNTNTVSAIPKDNTTVRADDEAEKIAIETEKNIKKNTEDAKETPVNKVENTDENIAVKKSEVSVLKNATPNSNNGYKVPSANNSQNNILQGKVTNENGEPVLATVNVITNDKRKYNFTTNYQGDFKINVPDTNVIVSLNSVGYTNFTTNLSTNVTNNNIVLQKSREDLAEVVVISNNNIQKKQTTAAVTTVTADKINTGATPVGGWQAFYDYVNKKKNEEMLALDSANTMNEDVTVEFKVDDDGTPYNISTSRNNNTKVVTKAKEIIKDGPKWTNTKKGKKVKVILKF